MSFEGKVALITGANKNLGLKTAESLASKKCNLAIHYHTKTESSKVENLVKKFESEYDIKVIAIQANLINEDETKSLFAKVIEYFGKIDIAINNIGMVLRKPLSETTIEEYDTMFNINTKTAFLFLRESSKNVNDGGSVIMLTTSLLAAYTDGYSLYQASKGAVHSMVKTLSKEDKRKISYNCVSPGPMDTPFLYGQETKERVEFFKTVSAHHRLTQIDDIVPIVVFLAKDGHWMTGQNLFANNGFTAPV
ncbi:hypothetical protein CANARDRAFT_22878 [[Candida] arabinofermentans NRRL YB-2248]|uniref:Uncharacterized protein n=1 Tax=[Candida] arabinofermentans NRRL YB-2248 TaxID=983967 RepID=A0A1E4T2Z6_9ASCO|nr:hypothetical protein CANARDRAFT_22878 [[Candida] arabinofermentans NRRL YB-2248]